MYTQPLPPDVSVAAPASVGHAATRSAPRARGHRVAAWLFGSRALGLYAITTLCAIPVVTAARYVETGPGTWFGRLPKHELVRTEWLFGSVILGLYALLALGVWLVWRRDWPEPERRRALAVVGIQLVVASAWTVVLFGNQSLDVGLLAAAVLWLVTLGMLTTLAPANWLAGLLAMPMFAWATYAVVVNATLVLTT